MSALNNLYNQPRLGLFDKQAILNGIKQSLEGSDEKLTPSDISSIAGLSDCEIIDLINRVFKTDIKTDKGLNDVNYIFFKALDAYEASIGRMKKYKIQKEEFEEFKNVDEVIAFLRETEEDTKLARIHCVIAKFCRAVDNVLNSPMVQALENKMVEVLSTLQEPLFLEPVGDDFTGHFGGGANQINFVLSGRSKGSLSCILKAMHDPNYDKIDEIKDGVGLTLKTKNWEEAIKLMGYVDGILSEHNLEVKAKGDEFKSIIKGSDNLPIDFTQKLNDVKIVRKNGSSEGYLDIKLFGSIGNIPIEIKFTLLNSQNENGVNFQPIYKGLKGGIEGDLIRSAQHYATLDDIKHIAGNLINNMQNYIDESPIKKGTLLEDYYRELWIDLKRDGFIHENITYKHIPTLTGRKKVLKAALVEYYKSKLKKKKLKSGKIVYVNARALELSATGLYPDFLKAT